MSAEDLEKYETEMELQLYREYRDVVGMFAYVVETERRFYLANDVKVEVRNAGSDIYYELTMSDAWVWDMYRPARFVKNVRVLTFKDVNVEELAKSDLENFEAERELQLAQEYQDVAGMFRYAVETERRFYLANDVKLNVSGDAARPVIEVELTDAWVWDMYRKSRFVPKVRVLTFKDVNVEELPSAEL